MKHTLSKQIRKLNLLQASNSFFYFLSHGFIVKKFFHDDLVQEYEAKEGIQLAIETVQFFIGIGKKLLYLFLVYMYADEVSGNSFFLLFMLLTIGGSAFREIISCDKEAYTYTILLHCDSHEYAVYQLNNYLVKEVIYFVPAFIGMAGLFHVPFGYCLGFLAVYLAMHLIGEFFDKRKLMRKGYIKEPLKPINMRVIILVLLIAALVLLSFFPLEIKDGTLLLVCSPLVIGGVLSYLYLRRKPDYQKMFRYNIEEAAIEIKNQGIRDGQSGYVSIENMNKKIELNVTSDRHGYRYIFDLFCQRYRKSIYRGVLLRSAIIAVVGFGALVVPLLADDLDGSVLAGGIIGHLNYLVYPIYYLASGSSKNLVLACYLQIDRNLINYRFFRNRTSVSDNFKMRLLKSLEVMSIPICTLTVFLAVIYAIHAKFFMVREFLAIILFPLVLAVFFAVYNLAAYYLFQPYSYDGTVVNKVYGVVDYIIYLVSYISMQITLTFSLRVIVIIIIIFAVISAILYWVVLNRAPKTFRVR